MASFRCVSSWLALAMTIAVGVLHAQDISAPIEDEVRQRLRVNTDMSPLGKSPFGESVNLYNGTFSFEQTDIDLKGNGPDLRLTRSYTAVDTAAPFWREFVDWKMEIPHIETLVTPNESGFFINSTNGRCSAIASNGPSPISLPNNSGFPVLLDTYAWWYGYHLVIPGEGSKDLILPGTQNTRPLPHMTLSNGQAFNAIMTTADNWAIGCLSSTSNGAPGEGFLAIAPDGTQYWLDHLTYKRANDYGQAPDSITRNLAMMMVSRVVDRFGNSLTYNYDTNNNLTTISASDGRLLTLTYGSYTIYPSAELANPDPGFRVATAYVTASDGTTRTWSYSYDPNPNDQGDLIGVTLPDGSAWTYSLDAFRPYEDSADLRMIDYVATYTPCTYTLEPQLALTFSGTITHPSGLVGTFTAQNTIRGESYVPYGCESSQSNYYLYWRDVMSYTALVQKSFSGAGLSTPETWNYSYSAPNQSWTTDNCASNNSCPSTIYTDVVDPNGNDVRYTYSNRFDATENQLLDTTYYQGAAGSSVVRDVQTTYAASNTGPWPTSLGRSLGGELNTALVTSLVPLNQRQTLQNGDTYTWQAVAFDAYAQPTDEKRFSSIAGQNPIEETKTYLNDPTLWVLGLPEVVTNVTNGTNQIESANTYFTNDTLQSRASFGETVMNYMFNSAGQLASFTDGNNYATSLSNYYRGIPRLISYPDQTSESLAVDDFGEITGITDQNGHTTNYQYDPMSRVAQITYPAGDEVAWYPQTFTYNFVTGAERGIAANHWRRTVTTGNYNEVTYFDAMLRPLLADSNITGVSGSDITTASAYDWSGQTVFASYPVIGAPNVSDSAVSTGMHHTYDALERAIQTQQDSELGLLTTTTAYLSGAGMQVTDPSANVTTTYYQVFDEPSYNAPIEVQSPGGITQNIARDIYESPVSITQSGLYGTESESVTKTLTYDIYHRLCRTTEPESGDEVTAYDPANNIRFTASGLSLSETGCARDEVPIAAQTTYTYDPMNRVKTIVPPAGTQSTQYTYDFVGNLKTAVSGTSTWQGVYNYRNMLTGESLQLSGLSPWALGYAHDANGNLSLIQYPNGENVSYNPNPRGRARQVGSYASNIGYYPNDAVASFTYGNGTSYVADQNARQLLSGFSYGTGGALNLSEIFSFDNNADMLTVQDMVNGQRSKLFHYDGLNRLTSASAPGLSINETYGYDALNNLRQRVINGLPFNFNIDASNHLNNTTVGSSLYASYGYDPSGDRTSVTSSGITLSYTFDAKQQLLAVPTVASYAYDAFGRRTTKTPASGGAPVYSFYDHGGQLMYQYAPSTSQGTNYIYLGAKLIARDSTVVLSPPGAVTFSSNPNNGNYTVSWGAVPLATSYNVQENFNGTGWSTASTGGSATSVTLTGRAGGSYNYQVQGCANGACGPWTTSGTLGVWPSAPTNVAGPTSLTFAPFTVSWTAPVGATSYTVQQSFNGGAWTTLATGITTPSISVTSAPGGSYAYQVSASNSYGTSSWGASLAVSVTQVPDTPTNVVLDKTTGLLTWDAMPWATTYALVVNPGGINIGTYYYTINTNSWSSPPVQGTSYELSACSIAGCSAQVAAGGGSHGLGDAARSAIGASIQKGKRALGDDADSGTGCNATTCSVILGGSP